MLSALVKSHNAQYNACLPHQLDIYVVFIQHAIYKGTLGGVWYITVTHCHRGQGTLPCIYKGTESAQSYSSYTHTMDM